MIRPQDYELRANAAEKRATEHVGVMRAHFLEIARQWRELAKQAGELDERRTKH